MSRLVDISSEAKKLLSSFLGKQAIPTPPLSQTVEPAETTHSDKQGAVDTVISGNESLHGQPSTKDLTLVTSYPNPSKISSVVVAPMPPTRAVSHENGFVAPTSVDRSAKTSHSDKQEAVNTIISSHFGFSESLHGQPSRNDSTLLINYQIPSKLSSVLVASRRPTHAVSQENGFAAPRSVGRFGKYRNARSPYARVPSTTTFHGTSTSAVVQENGVGASRSVGRSAICRMACNDTFGLKSALLQTSRSNCTTLTKRKQMSSDNDIEPVRRVRRLPQKVNLLPGFGGVSFVHGNGLNSSSALCQPSAEKMVLVGRSSVRSVDNDQQGSVLDVIPSRSCELASRILQQLEVEVTSIEESPRKPSPTMPNSPPQRSLKKPKKSPSMMSPSMPNTAAIRTLEEPTFQMSACENRLDDAGHSTSPPQRSLKKPKKSPSMMSPSMPNTTAIRTLEEPTFEMSACENRLDDADHSTSKALVLFDGKQKLDTDVASRAAEKVPPLSFPSLQAEPSLPGPDLSPGSAPYPTSDEKSLSMGKSSTFRFSLAEVCLESDDDNDGEIPDFSFPSLQLIQQAEVSLSTLKIGAPPVQKSLLMGKSSTFRFSLAEVCLESDDDDDGEIPDFSFPSLQLIQQAEVSLSILKIGAPPVQKSLLMGKSSTFRFSLAEVCLESDDDDDGEIPDFSFPSLQLTQQAAVSLSTLKIGAPPVQNPQSFNGCKPIR